MPRAGLYDMTMLRFPSAQKLADRLYFRKDGTLSYFFSLEVVRELLTSVGLVEVSIVWHDTFSGAAMDGNSILCLAREMVLRTCCDVQEELQYACVQLVNRRKQVPMKRVWVHAKFTKPETAAVCTR